jgi:hypothetical protein
MRLLRYILKSMTLLNMLLVAVVALVAVYVLLPLLNMKVTYKPPVVAETPTVQEEKLAPSQSPPHSDYLVVAEQNVFHPERKIPPEAKDEKTLTRPEIFLYGTLLTDDLRLAYIEDRKSPQSSPGRGKRQSVVKQGDTVSGFLLKSVEKDRIVLVRGEEQIIVLLDDAKKTREAVASVPGTVTPVGIPARASTPSSPASIAPTRQPTTVLPTQPLPGQIGAQPPAPTYSTGAQPSPTPGRVQRPPSAADLRK